MSSLLWKYFLENDIDRFRHTLARATYSTSSQNKTKSQGLSSSPGNALSTSPTLTKNRRQNEKTQKNQSKGRHDEITLTRSDINWKDGQGRTLLHHIASSTLPNAHKFAEALLQLPLLDLYVQDEESGWTALHRAFYIGNIIVARLLIDRDLQDAVSTTSTHTVAGLIKIKDREGHSPFDVYGTTVTTRMIRDSTAVAREGSDDEDNDLAHGVSGDVDEEPDRRLQPRVQINGDEIFAFGSNKNLNLGLGDEDDRQFPERVNLRRPDRLMYRFYEEYKYQNSPRRASEDKSQPFGIFEMPAAVRYRPIVVQDVQLSKLSSAILTTDPEANLYMCGFGSGGRLGTGDETTRFSYVNIQGGLTGRKVIAIALGQNHTIAITSQGETFTWGSNSFGQLGYAPNATLKDEEPVQLSPKQVYGPLKREIVVGVAASRIHSAVFTSSSLYTFGKNEGQMGLVDSDARSLISQTTPRKVGASLFTSPIKAVTAIDKATICLLESHEVMVFANYGYNKVHFHVNSSAKFLMELGQNVDRFGQGRPIMEGNEVMKITSGGDTVCAMTALGDVYTVQVSQPPEPTATPSSTTNPSKIKGALSQPQLIWSLKKAHMAVRDVDVGQDGSIIICTESGSVWRRIKRAKINNGGSATYKAKDYKFSRVPGLTRIIAVRSNTFGAYAAVRHDTNILQSQLEVMGPTLWKEISPLQPFDGYGAEDSDTENPAPRFWTSGQPTDLASLRRAVLTNDDLEDDLCDFFSIKTTTHDLKIGTTVSDVRIPIHSFILAGRSPIMDKGLLVFRQAYFYSIPEIVNVEYDSEGNALVLFQGIDFITLVNLAIYIYTDSVVDVWQFTRRSPEYAFRYRQVRAELMKVASALELRKLEHAVRLMTRPPPSLDDDFERAIRSPTYFLNGDIEVELDGASQRVHSALVCQRCPFFEGMFQGRAAGHWLSSRIDREDDAISVDLTHVDPHIFSFVLRHIYADTDDSMFNDVVTADLDTYLDLVIDVMSVANELMLDRLAQSCQKVLGNYVNTRNVCQLLNAVAPCSVTEFKDAALEYICLNLEGMLENHLLGELDDDLMVELDQVVQQNQLTRMSFVKSGKALADLMERHPVLVERLHRDKSAKIDRAYLASRLREKENRPSMMSRASGDLLKDFDVTQKSPKLAGKDRRQSDAKSPMLRAASSGHDLMFEMDEDDKRSRQPATPKTPSVVAQQLAALELPEATEYGLEHDAASAGSSLAISGPADPPSSLHARKSNQKLPWSKSAMTNSKLDMKEIMAQASSNRTSTISTALKQPETSRSTSTKLSQKERKKLQQQQQLQQAQPSSSQPDPVPIPQAKGKPAPWQRASSGPRVSLKDVIGIEASSHSTKKPAMPNSPSMTLRQTVSGRSPARRIASEPAHPSASAHRTVSPTISKAQPSTPSPGRPTSSSSHARSTPSKPTLSPPHSLTTYTATFQSIQHNTPSSAEPSLQLSMQDILAQQQMQKDVLKDAVAKRSLQDIQEEQAFQEWWDEESRKVQEREGEKEGKEMRRRGVRLRRGGSRGRGRGRGGG